MRAAIVAFALLLAFLAAAAPGRAQDTAGVVAYPVGFFDDPQPKNAREMVGRIPGFKYDEGRVGDEPRPGNVLINGKPAPADGRRLSDALRAIPAKDVRRIELITGGAGGVDMRGLPLVANVVARRPDAFRGTVNASASTQHEGRSGGALGLSMQSRSPERTIDVALNASMTPSGGSLVLRERRSTTTGDLISSSRYTSGGRSARLDGRLAYDRQVLGGRLRINGTTAFSDSQSNSVTLNTLTGSQSTSQSESASNSRNLSVRYDRPFGDKLELSTRLVRTANDAHSTSFLSDRDFTSHRSQGGWQTFFQAAYEPTEALTVRGGLDTDYDSQGGSSLTLQNGRPVGALSTQTDATRTRLVPFIAADFEARPNVRIEGALRYDVATLETFGDAAYERTFEYVRPSALVSYNPDRRTQASLQIERTVDPVNLSSFIAFVERNTSDDEDVIIAGNTDLVPQTSWVIRARFQKRFEGGGLVSLNSTRMEMDDIFERVLLTRITPHPTLPGQTVTRYFEASGNVGRGWRQDVNVAVELPLTPVGLKEGRLRLSSTWRESELTDGMTGQRRGFSGETPFSWSANFSAAFMDGAWRTGADVSGGSDSISYARSELTHSSREPYVTTYLEYRPQPDLTARFEIRDLTSRETFSMRDIYTCSGCESARAEGQLASQEARTSVAGPSFHMNVRRTF